MITPTILRKDSSKMHDSTQWLCLIVLYSMLRALVNYRTLISPNCAGHVDHRPSWRTMHCFPTRTNCYPFIWTRISFTKPCPSIIVSTSRNPTNKAMRATNTRKARYTTNPTGPSHCRPHIHGFVHHSFSLQPLQLGRCLFRVALRKLGIVVTVARLRLEAQEHSGE